MKIGDFSKLTGLPVKTLRYWSDAGLLHPARPTGERGNDGYRDYTAAQLAEVNRILALKEAGFTLSEIRALNRHPLSRDRLRDLLTDKLRQAEKERLLIDGRIASLHARLKHIEYEEDYNMADVTVKNQPPIPVASIRAKGMTDDEFSGFFGRVSDDARAHGIREVGAWICIRHTDDDWEACAQIERLYKTDDPLITVHELPAVEKMACIIHRGPWGSAMKPTIDDFFDWVRLNGAQLTRPYREIFHAGEREGVSSADFVTELQYPLA